MEKDFIPYEQALALKELGFDEPCLAGWSHPFEHNPEGYLNLDQEGEHDFEAPLYQQAFRWFREKYKLFMLIQAGQHNGEHQTFYFNVFEFGINLYKSKFRSKTGVYTYEEAELACLEKLIEIVNQNKDE